jgi:hypothetical protein
MRRTRLCVVLFRYIGTPGMPVRGFTIDRDGELRWMLLMRIGKTGSYTAPGAQQADCDAPAESDFCAR